jgi:TPR repeat protein
MLRLGLQMSAAARSKGLMSKIRDKVLGKGRTVTVQDAPPPAAMQPIGATVELLTDTEVASRLRTISASEPLLVTGARAFLGGRSEESPELALLLRGAPPMPDDEFFAAQSDSSPQTRDPATGATLRLSGLVELEWGYWSKALFTFAVAAMRGDGQAMAILGELCRHGRGIPPSSDAAREWYRRAAQAGFAPAHAFRALIEQEREPSAILSQELADGVKQARSSLKFPPKFATIFCPYEFRITVPESLPVAASDVALVAAFHIMAGSLGAADLPEVARLARLAAERGSVRGQVLLGYLYKNGTGVEEDDRAALPWLRSAAEQNDPEAALLLAETLRLGSGGVEVDEPGAMRLYGAVAGAPDDPRWEKAKELAKMRLEIINSPILSLVSKILIKLVSGVAMLLAIFRSTGSDNTSPPGQAHLLPDLPWLPWTCVRCAANSGKILVMFAVLDKLSGASKLPFGGPGAWFCLGVWYWFIARAVMGRWDWARRLLSLTIALTMFSTLYGITGFITPRATGEEWNGIIAAAGVVATLGLLALYALRSPSARNYCSRK